MVHRSHFWYRKQASTRARCISRPAEKKINAKSIMGMMSLSLAGGEQITVVTDGEDEKKAAEDIRSFFAAAK